MSKARLKTKVKHLAGACNPHGFVLDGPFRLKRCVPYIDQFIEIQPGHDWLEGKYTCNLCWKHTADGVAVDDVYDHIVNLGLLVGNSELWLSHETKDNLDVTYRQFKTLLLETGIPFLDGVSDLKKMVEMYEEAAGTPGSVEVRTDARSFFGVDEGWKHYNLGFAYKVLGNQGKAKTHFTIVVEEHSDPAFDWVQERLKRCIEAIAST